MSFRVYLIIVLTGFVTKGRAQSDFLRKYLEAINPLSKTSVCYDYSVKLVDMKTLKTIDSIYGKLYKTPNGFVDSSELLYVAMDGRYYLKLDHVEKTAFVYDVAYIQQKLDIDIGNADHMLNIPDSFLLNPLVFKADTSGFQTDRFEWKFSNEMPFSAFTLYISKNPRRIQSVVFESIKKEDQCKRVYTIKNIKNNINAQAVNMEKICNVKNGKIILASKYSTYIIKQLLP